jgi:hypothetical protein
MPTYVAIQPPKLGRTTSKDLPEMPSWKACAALLTITASSTKIRWASSAAHWSSSPTKPQVRTTNPMDIEQAKAFNYQRAYAHIAEIVGERFPECEVTVVDMVRLLCLENDTLRMTLRMPLPRDVIKAAAGATCKQRLQLHRCPRAPLLSGSVV